MSRIQAGATNRWQRSYNMGGDLLGISQAKKTISPSIPVSFRDINSGNSFSTQTVPGDTLTLSDSQSPSTSVSHAPLVYHNGFMKTSCKRYNSSPLKKEPEEMFYCYSQRQTAGREPGQYWTRRQNDTHVILHCLGAEWELHCLFLQKSCTLAKMYKEALNGKKDHLSLHLLLGPDKSACENLQSSRLTSRPDISHSSHSEGRGKPTTENKGKINISLDVQDKLVTKTSMAVALQNLYTNEMQVEMQEIVGVLAAARFLQFPALFQECIMKMKAGISVSNVCLYYHAGCKYQQEKLIETCTDWLLLNLVPSLSTNLNLRDLPYELLLRLLKTQRLFTDTEYNLLRIVLYWVFLQENPAVDILPGYNHVLNYFKSFPKRCSFLQQVFGVKYIALFQCLHLHGITECNQIEAIRQINVFPQEWLSQILSDHYQALQNGGVIPHIKDFNAHAVRYGLVMNKDPPYASKIVSHYGFFFKLIAFQQDHDLFGFYIQRVKHTDPILSHQTLENHCVSVCQEREVQYQITVQYLREEKREEYCTGLLSQKFGKTPETEKSQVLTLVPPSTLLYVTYNFFFPPTAR